MPVPVAKADYGIDAPTIVFGLVVITFVLTFAGIFFGSGTSNAAVGLPFWCIAAGTGLTAVAMVVSSRWGKRRVWRRVLDGLALTGSEEVLDLGCGRGLVLIEAAKRVPDGHVTGIDLWRTKDQSGNSRTTTELNLRNERVAERATVTDGTMTDLPWPDGSFDLVTASLAIHNLDDGALRRRTVTEAVRVLRPGGRVVIVDIAGAGEQVDALRAAGCTDISRRRAGFGIWPPATVVTARRAD